MSIETDLKDTIEQIGRRFEEFKTENNRLIAKGVKDALAESKLEQLSQSIDDLTGKKDDLEKRLKSEAEHREALERKVNQLRLGGGDPATGDAEAKAVAAFNRDLKAIAAETSRQATPLDVEAYRAYKGAFFDWSRKGDKAMLPEQIKALQVSVDSDGGYLVPADTTGRIVTRMYELSPVRAIASVQPVSSDALEGIEDTDQMAAGWVGEAAARNDTANAQLGKYRIPVHEAYAQPKATQKILDDAAVDIEGWLTEKIADRLARLEGAAYCVGDGQLKPRGFAAYPTAATADGTRSWGTLEHINTGVSGDFASSTPADLLFDLTEALKPAYRGNARWVTRRTVLTRIRKFKESTTNAYLWQPGLQAGAPSTLLGFPITMAEDMPALGNGSLSLAFGDFRTGYQIVDRLGIRVLRDPYTDKPYVKFYTTKRTGGAVVNFEAIKFARFGS